MFREIGDIVALQQEHNWIPVEEGNPNSGEYYWVCEPEHPFTTKQVRLMRYFSNEGWPDGVTHYTPKKSFKPPEGF